MAGTSDREVDPGNNPKKNIIINKEITPANILFLVISIRFVLKTV